ncbi:SRPBCC family protein [Oceanobacillus piezotolerans]|uniref:SRPBCC family protein n=1 Tax=Oceanobacillus piezotolerans TaxID=2448030 RepID=A0A498D8B2_9BACI|nr:SRPBCC family protein [Oceanobacillus piezotolerans]RLL46776.1 SRPBCC family protein [Oceanobacillus piezotolerans]
MAKGMHVVEIELPINQIWRFVSEMDNWAPLIPGYESHQKINIKKSIWKLHGDIGIMQKTVIVHIDITEWIEPDKISFTLATASKTCVGSGYFQAKAIGPEKTEMTGFLDIGINGRMKTVVSPVLKSLVPKIGKDFTEKVAKAMISKEKIRATV